VNGEVTILKKPEMGWKKHENVFDKKNWSQHQRQEEQSVGSGLEPMRNRENDRPLPLVDLEENKLQTFNMGREGKVLVGNGGKVAG